MFLIINEWHCYSSPYSPLHTPLAVTGCAPRIAFFILKRYLQFTFHNLKLNIPKYKYFYMYGIEIDLILVTYRGSQCYVLLFLYDVLKFTNSAKEECVSVEERPEVKSPPAERDPFHWRPLLSLSCSTVLPPPLSLLYCSVWPWRSVRNPAASTLYVGAV